MSYKILQPEVVIWKGVELNIKQVDSQLAILSINSPEDESYFYAVDRITKLNLWAVDRLSRLTLKQFDIKKPSFACAVIPQTIFLGTTGIPKSYSWAKICSRNLQPKDRENLVVASSQYADSIDFDPKTPLETMDERQIDILREIVHEHLPTMRNHYLQYPSSRSLPISEAMDELVPRYLLGLQDHMPASTTFLINISYDKLLTTQDLWGGFSQHSSEPISQNIDYGSAFLLGLGLIHHIEQAHNVDPESALNMWMNAIVAAETPESTVTNLALTAQVSQKEIWQEKSMQLSGQEILAQKIHP